MSHENKRDIKVEFSCDRRIHRWYDHPSEEITYEDSYRRLCPKTISFSSRLGLNSMDIYRQTLTGFFVPQQVHPTILEKLARVLRTAKRERTIVVLIAHVTARLLGSFSDLDAVDHHIRAFTEVRFNFRLTTRACDYVHETETIGGDADYDDNVDVVVDSHPEETAALTFEFVPLRLVPATRSARKSLRRVRLDSLDKATLELNSICSICSEEFSVEEDDGVDRLLIPLPCGHYHHEDCIIRWLKTSHYCPLCRYALPNVKDEEAKPSGSS